MQPTVTIIDDDLSAREALAGLLEAFGFRVVAHASAGEFLERSMAAETGCLIVDVHMPDMGGIELQCELIRLKRRVPIIFVTAFPDAPTRTRAMEAGAAAFLSKPIRHRELIDIVQTTLGLAP